MRAPLAQQAWKGAYAQAAGFFATTSTPVDGASLKKADGMSRSASEPPADSMKGKWRDVVHGRPLETKKRQFLSNWSEVAESMCTTSTEAGFALGLSASQPSLAEAVSNTAPAMHTPLLSYTSAASSNTTVHPHDGTPARSPSIANSTPHDAWPWRHPRTDPDMRTSSPIPARTHIPSEAQPPSAGASQRCYSHWVEQPHVLPAEKFSTRYVRLPQTPRVQYDPEVSARERIQLSRRSQVSPRISLRRV